MKEFVINVMQIEELQTIKDIDGLENIFTRAKSTIVNGEKVILAREDKTGKSEKFDELTTLDDLQQYKKRVFRYLS